MSWRAAAYRGVRPILFAAEPEAIHGMTLRALSVSGRSATGRALVRFACGSPMPLAVTTPAPRGLAFRNRLGLAAGFDKDGIAIRGWAASGLGFVELGTVTPVGQAGHSRPRLHRLATHQALVNRMGFNNAGAQALAVRVGAVRRHLPAGFGIGVNIGRNRDTDARDALADYLAAARAVAPVADYLAVNVSSPNTPGLRELQAPDRLFHLVESVATLAPRRPLFVKLAPDLDQAAFDELLAVLADSPVDGLILSNTTLVRPREIGAGPVPTGGLSGAPLFERMLASVARARERAGSRFTIMASGGIASGEDARRAIDAGANFVQLWTGLVYRGPGLIGEVLAATG